MFIDKCSFLPLPQACTVVVMQEFSPLLWRWFFSCMYSGIVNSASLPELFFHPPP